MAIKLSWRPRRPVVLFGVLGTVVVLVLAVAALMNDLWREKSMPIQGNAAPTITTDDLDRHGSHQGVLRSSVRGGERARRHRRRLREARYSAPPIEQGRTEPGPDGGFIAHEFIGETSTRCSRSKPSTKRCAAAWPRRSTLR